MTAWRTTWWTIAGLVAVAGALGTPLAWATPKQSQ